MSITYYHFPAIPDSIKKIIIEQAYNINFEKNDYNLTASDKLLNTIKDYTPDFTKSLGVPFTVAQNYFINRIAYFAFIDAPDVLINWVKNNIPLPVKSINIQVMHGGEIIAPHIDEIRKGALNYIISAGGNNVSTSFYEPNNTELVSAPQMSFPYDSVTLIESTVIPTEQWHILNVQKIHGVSNMNINDYRISISLSL